MNRNIFFVIIAATLVAFAIAFSRYHIERKKHRKRASEALYTLIMDNSILAAIGALLLLVILVIAGFDLDQDDILDVKALVTILFTGVIGLLLMVGRGYAINKLEDSIKLTHDYKGLLSQYRAEKRWYTYKNSISAADNYVQLSKDEKSSFTKSDNTVKFPVIIDRWLNDMPVEIHDSAEMYELPAEIKPFEAELFQAHDTSHLYNQLNVKVKDWGVQDNKFVIHSARTTYFKSMVTNRVMDFRMKNEMTVRDILQYGPFVPDIVDSKLSNHLGFNGFIITSDNKLPLVKRSNDMSIAKGTYGPSVGASLKTMYCLDVDMKFTMDGLLNGMRREIQDELKIEPEDLTDFTVDNIIAAYRDIVEGNKPQLLICYRINKTKDEVHQHFIDFMREKRKSEKHYKSIEQQEEEDGRKLLWLDVAGLDDNIYTQSCIIHDGTRYSSVPSAIVSLLAVKEYLCKS